MKIQTKIYEALLHMKLSDHLRRSQTTETRHWPAHSKKNRALNHAEIQHMLQFLHFKERMKFCKVCKLWKKVIEKTKIEHFVMMSEFTNISKESAAKIWPLVRNIALFNETRETFPNKLKQGTMFPKFTGLKALVLYDRTGFSNINLISISKLICASAKTLEAIIVQKNFNAFAFFFMGTTFPNLTNFVLETETNDIEFLKEFLNRIPEMFPNL